MLLLICVAFIVGFIAVAAFLPDKPNSWILFSLAAALGVVALLGAAAALWGCNSCVVRLWGDA